MSKYGEPCKMVPGAQCYKGFGCPDCSTYRAYAEQCVNACAGLDMRNVPEGAVRELVRAALELFDSKCNTVCGNRADNCDFGSDLKAALAPFVKED